MYRLKSGQWPDDQHKVDLAFIGNIPNLCTWQANVDSTFVYETYIVSVSVYLYETEFLQNK